MQKRHPYRRPAYANKTNTFQSNFRVSVSFIKPRVKNFCSSRLNHLCADHFTGKLYPVLDKKCLISIPYPKLNCLKTIHFTAAHARVA